MQAAREMLFAEMEKAEKQRKKAENDLEKTIPNDVNYDNVWDVYARARALHDEATRKFANFQREHRELLGLDDKTIV
jgi:predicted Zn-dependent protease